MIPLLMMGIIQTLAKPKTISALRLVSALRTSLRAMKSMMANKATTRREEQVGVVFRQAGERVEHDTIDFNKDGSRETRAMEEFNPVRVMVIGHGILLYCST
jgi:hypothetical protein